MTLDEFRNLKIGDEIVFKDGDVYKLDKIYTDSVLKMSFIRVGNAQKLIFLIQPISRYVTMHLNGINMTNIFFDSLNISLNKSEKEKIQDQIKILQDKLKELEKNDVENVIKTLVPGDFIEVYYKDPTETNPYIYEVLYINNSKIGIYSYKIENSWPIVINSISKIIVRKDIKEAYEKFLSLIRSNP